MKRDESGVEQVVEGANHVEEDEVDEAELQRRDEEARQAAELLEKEALELKERQERFELEEAERVAREEAAVEQTKSRVSQAEGRMDIAHLSQPSHLNSIRRDRCP